MIKVRDYLIDQKVMGNRDGQPPQISIVLPTHSRFKSRMLQRSVDSVLKQTFEDFELIIVDDGSVDGSNEYIESVRERDARVIHVRHERNSGIHSVRLNEGLVLTRGKYIGFQFDDDELLPNALADLYAEVNRHAEPCFVLGHSMYTGPNGNWVLPHVEINLVTLYEQNRFANNAVLFPRTLIETYGMYDCHIGMRRLCDWDLWLRFIKHVPFFVIPQKITRVFESNPGSLGLTVPYDLPLFYYLHAIPRNHLLKPETWQDYEIDSLTIGRHVLENDFARRVYEEQIVPYYLRFRHYFPQVEGFSASYFSIPKRSVLITKQSYDTCNDVTLTHYDHIADLRETYKSYFQPLSRVDANWPGEADQLVLLRTVEEPARKVIAEARQASKPVGFYLDDDLLTFHEYGSEFGYLAPGTPLHQNLQEFISEADGVMVTNSFIAQSVEPLNPRIIPHNNSIPLEYLDQRVRGRKDGQAVRIGYVGQPYRIEEFSRLWDAFVRISEDYREKIEFEFWGLDVSPLKPLKSPVTVRAFNWSYLAYLQDLKEAHFDILLCPLLDRPRPRLGKSLIKYYETAVAGAVGIFSDVPQYRSLVDGLTCLKAGNRAEDWERVLRLALDMPAKDFDTLRQRALEHVREEYTNTAQIHLHEAALRAVEFHGLTRGLRHSDGRPRILYVLHSVFFGGAEIQLWRRLQLVRTYGVEPIVVMPAFFQNTDQAQKMRQWLESEQIQVEFVDYICYTEPHLPEKINQDQIRQIKLMMERCRPAVVHTVTYIPAFGIACRELKIPHVSTQYAIRDDFKWDYDPAEMKYCQVIQSDSMRYATQWQQMLGECVKFCARDVAPAESFALGQRRYLDSIGEPIAGWPARPVRMLVAGTFQERKQQLETIRAAGKLVRDGVDLHLDLYGYTHYFPDYVNRCKKLIKDLKLDDRVRIHDYESNITSILEKTDILLSLSTFESFPGAIKDAFAAGVLVVATPVGGVKELVIDGISGIVCADTTLDGLVEGIQRAVGLSSEQWQRITQQARRVARSELHPQRAAADIFTMYTTAILRLRDPDSTATRQGLAASDVKVGARRVESFIAPADLPAGAVYLGQGLRYRYAVQQKDLCGLGIIIGTSMRPAEGILRLTLRGLKGQLIRKVDYELKDVHDNEWIDFKFAPIHNSEGRTFLVEINLHQPGRQTLISIYGKNYHEPRLMRGIRRLARYLPFTLPGVRLYAREWYQ